MTNSIPAEITTIIDQLGGAQIFAMAFYQSAYDMAPAEGKVNITLHIAKPLTRGRGKPTHVTVTLMSDDTYTVLVQRVPSVSQFCKGAETVEIGRQDLVHVDSLRATVKSLTGLDLTLGPAGGRQ